MLLPFIFSLRSVVTNGVTPGTSDWNDAEGWDDSEIWND